MIQMDQDRRWVENQRPVGGGEDEQLATAVGSGGLEGVVALVATPGWLKRNTIRARATARLRSATSCPTAARPRPTPIFRKINDGGGINGRKVSFINDDDGYSPPKSVEQARKLVESDEVLLIFGALATPTNRAIQRMNSKKVPQLFVATGATKCPTTKTKRTFMRSVS
jgi:hypothetical protein